MLLRVSITRGLNRQMRFALLSIKYSAAPLCFRLLPSTVSLPELGSKIGLPLYVGGSRKLGAAAEQLIDDSEKRIYRTSFEF